MSGCPMGYGDGSPPPKSEENEKREKGIFIPPGLSADRETSSIPSEKGHWTYPSEQQFYKATRMKGHRVHAESVPAVVAIHNAVNEEVWRQIEKWEKMHAHACKSPKLLRFVGKPHELSLKAKLRHFVGFEKPFDRHDWFVDRCGHNVRYLIDFYDGKSRENEVSICVDVRPDLSSFSNVWDRIKMFFLRNSPFNENKQLNEIQKEINK